MAEVSRTARVIQNAKVALFFYCINLILQFFSRKIFLDYLGAELLGLNTTAQNLLQFLNLAESGIGTAVAFALYKPLSQGNKQETIDIVSLQGWFYRWVGLFVIAGSIVLMAFFPWIFAKAEVPLVYAYGTFIAFLISALLGYFVNYKMIVLSADQKEYKITIETQSIKVIKVFIQMLAIWKLPHGYVWWMVLEVLAAIATSIRLQYCVKKEYPWLCPDLLKGKHLKQRYPFLLVKTKQLFFHKVAGYVLGQMTPLIIFMFTSLSTVAKYGNYILVTGGCLMLIEALSRGLASSIGNFVVEKAKTQVVEIYWAIFTLRLYSAGIIAFCFFYLSESFITLWLGESYVFSVEIVILLALISFIQMSRTNDLFLSAYGQFQDIWAPILEVLLNISISIVLGCSWGLPGILIGVLVSLVLIVYCWKGYFLFRLVFKLSAMEYFVTLFVKLIVLLSSLILIYFLLKTYFSFLPFTNFVSWIFSATFVLVFSGVAVALLFLVIDPSFRRVALNFRYCKKVI